jgi:hypothetical protein
MTGKKLQHMVKKAYACVYAVFALAVEVKRE